MATVPTVNVTTHVEDNDGAALVGARVTFKLKNAVISTGVGHILPTVITSLTDSNGDVVTPVWPNALGTTASTYEVTIAGGGLKNVISLTADIPNNDCNLWDVANPPEAG